MTKIYTTKSNAQRAAKKFDVAQVVAVEGGFVVRTPEDNMDTEPTKDVNDDVGTTATIDPVEFPALAQAALDAEPSQVVQQDAPAEELEVMSFDPPEPVLMQLRVYVGADYATALAAKVATLVGNPVTVHNATSGTQLMMVQPGEKQAARTKKAGEPRPARDTSQPAGKTAEIIALASREVGVTRKELTAAIGWGDKAPWTQVLKKAAERFGYELTIDKDAGRATYFFTKAA